MITIASSAEAVGLAHRVKASVENPWWDLSESTNEELQALLGLIFEENNSVFAEFWAANYSVMNACAAEIQAGRAPDWQGAFEDAAPCDEEAAA